MTGSGVVDRWVEVGPIFVAERRCGGQASGKKRRGGGTATTNGQLCDIVAKQREKIIAEIRETAVGRR